MDHPTLLPRDSTMRTANHAEGEWLRKAKEDKKRKVKAVGVGTRGGH